MRARQLAIASACAASLVALASAARAEPMDPSIERLTLPFPDGSSCTTFDPSTGPASYRAGYPRCQLDQQSWRRLISQFGFALAPTPPPTARTTGFGGFQFSLQMAFTGIDGGADYWRRGTRGPQDDATHRYSSVNKSPDSMLGVYSLKIRKGFPFGFELTGNVGFVGHTSIIVGGADVRWSLLEGFRTGVPGIFPDVAVGAGVRTITPTAQFNLTVLGVEAMISKGLPLADSSVLTPYLGYQWIKIYGDSGTVDVTPNTDPLARCGYAGTNIPGTPGAKAPYDGQPVCNGGNFADVNNMQVFDPVRINRHRLVAGLQYRYEVVILGAQYITEIVSPGDANSGDDGAALAETPRQWTMAFEAGARF